MSTQPPPTTPAPAAPTQPVPQTPSNTNAAIPQVISQARAAGAEINAPSVGVPQRSTWEDPRRLVTYRNYIKNAPPATPLPDWLPAKEIETAYQYMKFRNGDKPWQDWKLLSDDDPIIPFLRQLPQPPAPFQTPEEHAATVTQVEEQGPPPAPELSWDALSPWQQLHNSLFAPQPTAISGRPAISRLPAAVMQGGMAGLAGAALGHAFLPGPGTLIGFLAVGGLTGLQIYTGQELPVVGPVIATGLGAFNLLAQGAETVNGIFRMGLPEWQIGWAQLLKDFPSAYQAAVAGSQSYNVAGAPILGTDVINWMGPVESGAIDLAYKLGLSSAPGGWVGPAAPGQVWQLSEGYREPQPAKGQLGVPAMLEYLQRLRNGEDRAALDIEYAQRVGDTGAMNEFLGQTIYDPLFAVPFLSALGAEGAAKLAGNARLADAARFGRGNLLIDALPFGIQQIAEAVTGVRGSSGILGVMQIYKDMVLRGTYAAGSKITPAEELTTFEKRTAGLTPEGRWSQLEPAQPKPGIAGFVQKLTTLTPASQAHMALSIFHDNINSALDAAAHDPAAMIDIVHKAARVSPLEAGDAAQAILAAPLTASIADGYRTAIADGFDQVMLGEWVQTEGPRAALLEIAKKLGRDPGKVLEQMTSAPEALVGEINAGKFTPQPATVDGLKALWEPYLREKEPALWHPDAFRAQLVTTLADRIDHWVAERYGLAPDHPVFRMSQALKGMQSFLLLGLNPAYFINNAVNNLVTRAAVGAFGFMTPHQIDGYMQRFGILPDRLRAGLTPGSDDVDTLHGAAIRAALHNGDWIDHVQDVVTSANKKVGLFSKFSTMNERAESGQAYTIGVKRYMGHFWRVDRGLSRMPRSLEGMLDRQMPGAKEAIYAAAQAGLNMDEIAAKLMGEFMLPQVEDAVRRAAARIFPASPDLGADLLRESGALEALQKNLKDARDIQDVDIAFGKLESQASSFVDELVRRDLVHRAEEVQNIVSGEGLPAALGLFSDLQVKIATRWLKHFTEWQDLVGRRAEMNAASYDQAVRTQMARDTQEWKRINSFELQTHAGIMRALGMSEEAATPFLEAMTERNAAWRRFYDGYDEPTQAGGTVHHPGRNEKLSAFFKAMRRKRGESEADYSSRYDAAWRKLQDELAGDYQRAVSEENRLEVRMNGLFAGAFADATHNPASAAAAWREQVLSIRMQMQQAMQEFRAATLEMNPAERRAAWTQFLQEYNGLIVALKQTEQDGAWKLAGQQPQGPTVPEAAAAVAAEAAAQAAARPPATEGAINAALAGTPAEAPVHPNVQHLIDLAKDNQIVRKSGEPVLAWMMNIINKRQPEGQKYASPDQVPPDVADAAMTAHKLAHAGEYAAAAASTRLSAEDIIKLAARDQRENALAAAGMQSRRSLREKLASSAFNAGEDQLETTLFLIDKHADQWARDHGWTPSEATRDAWYATNVADVISISRANGATLNQLYYRENSQWYYSQLERTLQSMPPKMTPAALAGFLKGKVRADEMRWAGLEEWLAGEEAAGRQVTREDVLRETQANLVRIDDVLLGGRADQNTLPEWTVTERKMNALGWRVETNEEFPEELRFSRLDDPDSDLLGAEELDSVDAISAATFLGIMQRAIARDATWTLSDQFIENRNNLEKAGWAVITRVEDPIQAEPLHFYKVDRNEPDGIDRNSDILTWEDVHAIYTAGTLSMDRRDMSLDAYYAMYNIHVASQQESFHPTHYQGYKEPGGENYRELLLTWANPPQQETFIDEADFQKWRRVHQAEDTLANRTYYATSMGLDTQANYQSPHWSEKNVLAHVRFDERAGPAGEKILFIEEIQSDWHEQGRKKGYQYEQPELIDRLSQIATRQGELARELSASQAIWEKARAAGKPSRKEFIHWNRLHDENFALYREANEIQKKLRAGVPAAPFAKNWEELVVKRMIRWAAENNFDRVEWTNGRMQADRYSLATQMDELRWVSVHGGDMTQLVGYRNGHRVLDEQVGSDELPDYVGVEIARQITGSKEEHGIITGQDLSVGGQGMRGFYDQMIPSLVSKYIKKWGGEVTTRDWNSKFGQAAEAQEQYVVNWFENQWRVVDAIDGSVLDTFPNQAEAESYRNRMMWHNTPDEVIIYDEAGEVQYWNMPAGEARGYMGPGDRMEPMDVAYARKYGTAPAAPDIVRGFDVTPAMRQAAMTGQPLFYRAGMTPEIATRMRFERAQAAAASYFGAENLDSLSQDLERLRTQTEPAAWNALYEYRAAKRAMEFVSTYGHAPSIEDVAILDRQGDSSFLYMRNETRAATQRNIQNPAFRRWFGESKVVDQIDGSPLPVFHGTNADFTVFDPNKVGQLDSGWFGRGFYFTKVPDIAEGYVYGPKIPSATHENPTNIPVGGNVMPVYLKIEHPFSYRANDLIPAAIIAQLTPAEIQAAIDWHGSVDIQRVHQAELLRSMGLDGEDRHTPNAARWTEILQRAGYDGEIINDGSEYLVFEPTQIKSAHNAGTFNPANPNILHAGGAGAGAQAAVEFLADGRAVLYAINQPTVIALNHELGHIFRRDLSEAYIDVVARAGGLKDGAELHELEALFQQNHPAWREYTDIRDLIDRGQATEADHARFNALAADPLVQKLARYESAEEDFARGWIRYLAEGDAPTPELRSVFRKFTDWMLDLYTALKRQLGRVVGFEQTLDYAGLDPARSFGGTTLRQVFDSLLTDQPERPISLEEWTRRRIDSLKEMPRYAAKTDAELERIATEGILTNALGSANSQAEALKLAEQMLERGSTLHFDDAEIDPSAVYDAARLAAARPELAPWNVAPQPAAPTLTLTVRERAILQNPTGRLPLPVREAVQAYARAMLADIAIGGTVRIGEDNAALGTHSERLREGNTTWYWRLYDQEKNPQIKRTVRAALEKIIAGTEDSSKPMVIHLKNQILAWAAGEEPTDQGMAPDPAVLWYLGTPASLERLFSGFGDRFLNESQEWYARVFGSQGDEALNGYLLYASEHAPAEPESAPAGVPAEVAVVPAPTTIAERAAAEAEAIAGQAERFNKGEPVPLDAVSQQELVGGPELAPSEGTLRARRQILSRAKTDPERAYAQELINWVEGGQQGDEPSPASLGIVQANRIRASVQVSSGPLKAYARDRARAIPLGQPPAPSHAIQALRVHTFQHGAATIAGAVYQDGIPVAYLPAGGLPAPFELGPGSGTARILGLDPEVPTQWVVERDGTLTRFDPDGPVLAQANLLGEPAAPGFKLEAQQAAPETFAPKPTTAQEGLFNRAEYLPKIEARQAAGGAEGPLFEQAAPLPAIPAEVLPQANVAKTLDDFTKSKPGKNTWGYRNGLDYYEIVKGKDAAQTTAYYVMKNDEQAGRMVMLVITSTRADAEKFINEHIAGTASNESPAGAPLFDRAQVERLTARAKEIWQTQNAIGGEDAGWITADGTILTFERYNAAGYFNMTHHDSLEALTGETLPDFYATAHAARLQRFDAGGFGQELSVELFSPPTPDQIETIVKATRSRAMTIEISVDTPEGPIHVGTQFFEPADGPEAVRDWLTESKQKYFGARFYDRAASYTPMISVNNLDTVPSPLSGYTGNKRTMLQAGHYNEILTAERAAGFRRIVEAFGGSGLLGNAFQQKLKLPRLLNELDPAVVGFHQVVKAQPKELIAAIHAESDAYLAIQKAHPDGGADAYDQVTNAWRGMQYRLSHGTPIEQAALLAINANGALGVRGSGGQGLIHGAGGADAYRWKTAGGDAWLKLEDQIRRHAELLKATEITGADARQTLAAATPDDLVLLDPPYTARGIDDERATGYAVGQDLTTLDGALKFIDQDMADAAHRGVPMIYTNNAHQAVIEALRENGFHIRLGKVFGERTEVIAWNDAVGAADSGWRAAQTQELLGALGSGRAEFLAYRARARHAQARTQVTGGASPTGQIPAGATPIADPTGMALDELGAEYLRPLLAQTRDEYASQIARGSLKFKGLDGEAQAGVQKYLHQVQSDLAATKYGAMAYGESLRDGALLNYSKRYGFDNYLGLAFPYQFWYTRSMVNWAGRMLERPQWYAMYARLRQLQENLGRSAVPTRLRGKVRIPAPFLPEWAGGGLWSDPMSKIFPFAQFGQPLERYTADQNQIARRAESILQDAVDAGRLPQRDAAAAIAAKDGPDWQNAVAQATVELDKDPTASSLVTQMIQPALWWTLGKNIFEGTPEKISTLPITRTGQALRTATRGTFLEGIGGLVGGAMAYPEEKIRDAAGLSQFGAWGDYYIDRQLSNMAAEGQISPEDAESAMIQRSGPAFDEAKARVDYETALRTPGFSTLEQASKGSLKGLLQSLPTLLLPGGLLPQGELKFRNLQTTYNHAWDRYTQGDSTALNAFFDANPEYQARLALFDKPADRLKQFLISAVWDRYTALDRPNASQAADFLGQQFQDSFLNKETRNYDDLDPATLARWAQALGAAVPQTKETAPAIQEPLGEPNYWAPEISKAITDYQTERGKQFPAISAIQNGYYGLPAGAQRKSYLARFPQLKSYWDWKKQYETKHPELAPYFEQGRAQAQAADAAGQRPTPQEMNQVTSPLMRSVAAYVLLGQPLSSGAKMELARIAALTGREESAEDYARRLMAGLTLP